MKKIIAAIFIVIFLLPCLAVAAGSDLAFALYTSTNEKTGNTWVQVVVTATADDADGSFPIEQIPYDLEQLVLHQIKVFPGATGPTANSDLYVLQHSNTGYDLLNGAGVDMVDNGVSDDTNFQPTIASSPLGVGVFGRLFVKLTGNSVNSATAIIVFDFIDLK